MTVKELIAKLKEANPDDIVVLSGHPDLSHYLDIDEITPMKLVAGRAYTCGVEHLCYNNVLNCRKWTRPTHEGIHLKSWLKRK